MVAASGTGLQQVATLLAAQGEGISQAIGVGGRDMSLAVGGLMTLAALDALGADAATEVIAVIGKPGAPAVRRAVETKLRAIGKPAVVALLGMDVRTGTEHGITTVATLEDACRAVIAGSRWSPRAFSLAPDEVRRRVEAARRGLRGRGDGHPRALCGRDARPRGRADPRALARPHRHEHESPHRPSGRGLSRPRGAGTGSSTSEPTSTPSHAPIPCSIPPCGCRRSPPRPATTTWASCCSTWCSAWAPPPIPRPTWRPRSRPRAAAAGPLAIVLSVIGTAADPQGLAGQITRLERAGAWVLPSNAQAARAAACIAGPDRVMNALLTDTR